MARGHFRHLPAVEDDRLAGIISIRDVVRTRIKEVDDARSLVAAAKMTVIPPVKGTLQREREHLGDPGDHP